jgi:hypothetical protein
MLLHPHLKPLVGSKLPAVQVGTGGVGVGAFPGQYSPFSGLKMETGVQPGKLGLYFPEPSQAKPDVVL